MTEAGRRTTDGLVDAHCHVDLFPEPPRLLLSIDEAGIHVVTVTNIPSVFHPNVSLAAPFNRVHVALGLHPELVRTYGHEVDRLCELLPEALFVGEVGLDFTTNDSGERDGQRAVFERVLHRCADVGGKVLTIHSRRAAADVIAMIGTSYPCSAILHWFSGTTGQLERAVAANLYFSVNTAMIGSKKGRELIERMDPDYVLTESDGPFARDGRAPREPSSVAQVVSYLAKNWGCSYESAKARVLSNFQRAVGAGLEL